MPKNCVKKYREVKHMSRAALARRCNTIEENIALIESGEFVIRLGRASGSLFRLLRTLGYRYGAFDQHVVLRALWRALLLTLQMTVLWGLGFAAVELAKGQMLK